MAHQLPDVAGTTPDCNSKEARGPAAPSRADHVGKRITQKLLDGELAAGDRLPVEKDLAAALSVSRGSLREGVRALTLLGVLDTRQGDGTYVTSLDASLLLGPMGLLVELQGAGNALHVHTVRRLLETEAAGLAATQVGTQGDNADTTRAALARARKALDDSAEILAAPDVHHETMLDADVAFHSAIADLAGNPVLAALIGALATRTARVRLWRGIVQEGVEQRTQQEHELIYQAVMDRDPERARVRMAVHLLGVEDFIQSTSAEPRAADGRRGRAAT